MTKQGDFLIYCVETYKNAKHLTGRQVAELFTRYDVWDYVYSCYEALHTTGANYIVEDIDLYIEATKAVILPRAMDTKGSPRSLLRGEKKSSSPWTAMSMGL